MTIQPATTLHELQTVETLAFAIMPEYYGALIPHEHNMYFLQKYQTLPALQQQLAAGAAYYLIYNPGGSAVGYFALEPNAGKGHTLLSKLYLLKECRGLGYGAKAMDFIIAQAAQNGLPVLQLSVIENNPGSIRFYGRFGFKVVDRVVRSFETGHHIPNYIMERSANAE